MSTATGMQTYAPATAGTEYWHEAVDLAGLHVCRNVNDLDRELVCKLVRLLPGTDMALCLTGDRPGRFKAQMVLGQGCPFPLAAEVDPGTWDLPDGRRYPLNYRNHGLGELLVDASPDAELERLLTVILAHYGVALVNLTLNDESRQATDHYCASLQSLEEGIVLFQESDPEAIAARLIGLATAMIQATAGALYVLHDVGDVESDLELTQTLGIPELLLKSFQGRDGQDWPRCLLNRPATSAWRDEDPTLGGLEPTLLPEILRNLAVMPLRYHGVVAGVCVLFNVIVPQDQIREHLERLNSLGQLGAALLHRLSLERESVRNRDFATQMAIAETIQRRLLPRAAPAVQGFDFAWRSIAAQNIGGDYLDLLKTEAGEVCCLIADASGHGINSALLMSSFRSSYRAVAPREAPARLLEGLNDEVHDEVGTTGMFITAAALRLDPVTRRMTIANAGHHAVLLYRRRSGTIERIDSHGPPLGFLEGAQYGSEEHVLQTGDVLVLYTDGITEAQGRDVEMFGEERLEACVKQNAAGSAEAILDAALAALSAFTGRGTYEDDVSISVVKVTG